MASRLTKRFVLLDANIWVSERMLHSALGAALLHGAIETETTIVLPETVKREVTGTLLRMFDDAMDNVNKSTRWVNQLTARKMTVSGPNRLAAEESLTRRWEELSGSVENVPLDLVHVQGALAKILNKEPPAGPNNEQFRDCCLWQVALERAQLRPVHLVSGDSAFFEGRSYPSGLAQNLEAEARGLGRQLVIHRTLEDFLASTFGSSKLGEQRELKAAILGAAKRKAAELASQNQFAGPLDDSASISITGFATPAPETLAVSFSVKFSGSRVFFREGVEKQSRLTVDIKGSLSWNPLTQQVQDEQFSEWSVSTSGEGGTETSWRGGPGWKDDFQEGRFQMFGYN